MRQIYVCAASVLLVSAAIIGCSQSETISEISTPETSDSIEATAISFANTKCPIMGGTPSPELTRQYQGDTIGFCCDGCPEKWDALDEGDKAAKFAEVDGHADPNHVDGEHDHSDHQGS